MSTEPEEKPSFEVKQEPDRVDPKRLRRAAVVAAAGMAVSVAATLFLLGTSGRHSPATSRTPAASGTVETSLVLSTDRGLALFREQRGELARFGWVDRDAGIARIPVERAMDLVVEDAGR